MAQDRTLSSCMRQRITFQSKTLTSDDCGGGEATYSDVVTVWAQVQALRNGQEKFIGSQVESIKKYRITICYMDNINNRMRIVYGTNIMGILSITNVDERHESLEIIAQEGGMYE